MSRKEASEMYPQPPASLRHAPTNFFLFPRGLAAPWLQWVAVTMAASSFGGPRLNRPPLKDFERQFFFRQKPPTELAFEPPARHDDGKPGRSEPLTAAFAVRQTFFFLPEADPCFVVVFFGP